MVFTEAINAGGGIGLGPILAGGAAAASMWASRRNNTRSTVVQPTGGSSVSRRKRRIGRNRKWSNYKIKKHIIGTGDEFINRWQQTSNTYLGPGRLFLGWSSAANPDFEQVPCHFISLTNIEDMGISNPSKGCFNSGIKGLVYHKPTSQFRYRIYPSQQASGTVDDSSGFWQYEKQSAVRNQFGHQFFHKYTDIKLNLYGTLDVPIKYSVIMCTLPEQLDFHQWGPNVDFGNGSELNNMCRDWMRSRLWDTVTTNANPKWPKDVRIIKQESITINPPPKTDAAAYATNSTSGSIHELRWFVRYDRYRDYKWSKNANETVNDIDFQNSGWDVSNPTTVMSDVEWGRRVYLVVMAESPYPRPLTSFPAQDFYANATTQIDQGSYDVCIRNCFRIQSY